MMSLAARPRRRSRFGVFLSLVLFSLLGALLLLQPVSASQATHSGSTGGQQQKHGRSEPRVLRAHAGQQREHVGRSVPPAVDLRPAPHDARNYAPLGGDLTAGVPPPPQEDELEEERGRQGHHPTRRRRLQGGSDDDDEEADDDDDSTSTQGDEPDTPAPIEPEPDPTPAPNTSGPTTAEPTAAQNTPAPTTVKPTPAPIAPAPTTAAPKPTPVPTQAPTTVPELATDEPAVEPAEDGGGGGDNKVATPRFTGAATHSIMTYTDHIECDTEGATIRYTIDGSDPATTTTTSVHEVSPGDPVYVNKIGTVTIRAVATKEGMENSDEAQKTVTIQDRVSDPKLSFVGEEATAEDVGGGDGNEPENAFLRTVVITMNCSTPNATLRYTTDGSSVPTGESPSVSPGTAVQWSEEGTTEFRVIAVADGLYESELTKWPVTIVAPRIDEYSVAVSASSSSGGDTGSDGSLLPSVEVTAFEAVYASPAAELEQQEMLGPGYGDKCEGGARVVRGKLVRLFNPIGHLSFAVPPGACDAGEQASPLSLASETVGAFKAARGVVPLLDGESIEEARGRLDLDAKEAVWRAAGGSGGCQVAAAGGLLPPAAGGGGCAIGHLVGSGQVFKADDGGGMVSFGIRGGSYVVGTVTADEVTDADNPFQNLISGAGWLVRAGVNHVEASARDGHLDVLRNNGGGGEGETSSNGDDGEAGAGDGGWLEDVLVAKLARTAIGHDSEGRLILLQTSGAAAGSDQDTAIPDGLDLSELADVLVEAGAVNAINLVGGAPSALLVNGSAVVDPAEPCWPEDGSGGGSFGVDGGGGFGNGSALPRCERPVSSVVCVHLDPPPLIEGTDGSTPAPTPAPYYSSSAAAAASSNAGGDDWQGGWDSGDGGDHEKEEVRLQWTRDLCGGNGTGNATGLWEHLDDVEESVLRYKIAFWVAAVLGMVSLYFNIQHQKGVSSATSRSAELDGGVYGRQQQQQQQQQHHVGLINGGIIKTGTSPVGVVEMISKGSKRGSRSSRRKRGSSNGGGGGYARVNGDADWDEDGGGVMDSEEEVDLGLAPSRSSSSRKRDKGKGGRLRRALSKVAKGGGGGAAGAPGHGGGDLDAAMALNPFGGGGGGGGEGGGRRGSGGGAGEAYGEEGNWA